MVSLVNYLKIWLFEFFLNVVIFFLKWLFTFFNLIIVYNLFKKQTEMAVNSSKKMSVMHKQEDNVVMVIQISLRQGDKAIKYS